MSEQSWIDQVLSFEVNPSWSNAAAFQTSLGAGLVPFYDEFVKQQLNMTAVYVTDPSLVYNMVGSAGNINRQGELANGYNREVIGTLFYKFDSNIAGAFWGNPGYKMGEWYWVDMAVGFETQQVNTYADIDKAMATTSPNYIHFYTADGIRDGLIFKGYDDNARPIVSVAEQIYDNDAYIGMNPFSTLPQ